MDSSEISGILGPYRSQIDDLDERIVALLARRFEVILTVADLKAAHCIPSVLPDRVEEVLERTAHLGKSYGLDADMVRAVYTILIDHAHVIEESAKARHAGASASPYRSGVL